MVMRIDVRLLYNKLQDDDKCSYSNNVLFDSTGKGILTLMQSIIYAMRFDTDGNFTSGLGDKLDIMPLANWVSLGQTDFNEYKVINRPKPIANININAPRGLTLSISSSSKPPRSSPNCSIGKM